MELLVLLLVLFSVLLLVQVFNLLGLGSAGPFQGLAFDLTDSSAPTTGSRILVMVLVLHRVLVFLLHLGLVLVLMA